MKTTLITIQKVTLIVTVLCATIFFTACNEEQPQAVIQTETQTVPVAVDSIKKAGIQTEVKVDLYNPNLDSLFALVSTNEEKKQLWLQVSDLAENNWLQLSEVYENKWLATTDSLEAVWLKKNEEALNEFKINDPVTYQEYLKAREDVDSVLAFVRNTTAPEYKKYLKNSVKNYTDYQKGSTLVYVIYQKESAKIYSHYQKISAKAYSYYEKLE